MWIMSKYQKLLEIYSFAVKIFPWLGVNSSLSQQLFLCYFLTEDTAYNFLLLDINDSKHGLLNFTYVNSKVTQNH